jgi:hypothetical protein
MVAGGNFNPGNDRDNGDRIEKTAWHNSPRSKVRWNISHSVKTVKSTRRTPIVRIHEIRHKSPTTEVPMRHSSSLLAAVFCISLVAIAQAAPPQATSNVLGQPPKAVAAQGTLVISGGRPADPIFDEFVRLAGGPKARVVLIPSASAARSSQVIGQFASTIASSNLPAETSCPSSLSGLLVFPRLAILRP